MITTIPMRAAGGLDTPVTELMRQGLITLPASATLTDAARAMRDNHVHAVLIAGAGGERLGWVTSRGVLHNHAHDWAVSAGAADAITEVPASVLPTATLADAIDVFVGTGASHILVTPADGMAVGVIADSDLVTFLAR